MHTDTQHQTGSRWDRGRRSRGWVLGVLLGLLGGWQMSQAAEFTCPSVGNVGDVACLIQAINDANANGETNTITLAAGTYTLTAINNGDEFEGTGLPVITSPLTLTGAGAERTVIARDTGGIDSGPFFRIMQVATTGTLTLQGLTLRGGGGNLFYSEGGGIANSGTLTLIDCTLTENRTGFDGGGISNRGTLRLTHTTVTRNLADMGSGISNGGTATITDSIIADNIGATRGGGGLWHFSEGTMSLTATTVTRNLSDGGGGSPLIAAR